MDFGSDSEEDWSTPRKRCREVERQVDVAGWMRTVESTEVDMHIERSIEAEAYLEKDMDSASEGRLSEAKRSRGSGSSLHSLDAFGVDLSLFEVNDAGLGGSPSRSASSPAGLMECDFAVGAIATVEGCSFDTLRGGEQRSNPLHRRVATLCEEADRICALRADGPTTTAHDHFLLHVARHRNRARSRLPTSWRRSEEWPEVR